MANSIVMTTSCGHTYHQDCILRWAQRQQTCPQCRAQLLAKPLRIYFNIEDEIDDANDAALMQHKVGELMRQFETLLQSQFHSILEENVPLKKENITLKERVTELEAQLSHKSVTIHAQKEKMIVLLAENRKLKDLGAQLDKAKKDLSLLRRFVPVFTAFVNF